MDVSEWRDREVLAHYERFLGTVHHTYVFGDLPDLVLGPLTVVECPPESGEYDWSYATVGMSRRAMRVPGEEDGAGFRAELVVNCRHREPQAAESLVDIAVYPFLEGTFLAAGHTIVGSPGQGFVPGSPLTDVFISNPVLDPEEFGVIHHSDGTHTHILWVIPVYPAERLVASGGNGLRLHELFADHQALPGDLHRDSVVTGKGPSRFSIRRLLGR